MKIFWVIFALLMFIIDFLVAIKIAGYFEPETIKHSSAAIASLGQVFGFPIILTAIVPIIKKHRNIKSISKAFALSSIVIVLASLSN